MCTVLQNGHWWYEFTIDGKRYRKSSRVKDRETAQLIEAEHRERLEQGLRELPPTLVSMEKERKAARLQIPSHTRLRAKQDVIGLLSGIGRGRVDELGEDVLANPTVQAEIRRQVELALHDQKALRPSGTSGMPSGVILFPRANAERGDHR
jgi:hypothetical protein